MCRWCLEPLRNPASSALAASSELLNSLVASVPLEKPGASGKESMTLVVVGAGSICGSDWAGDFADASMASTRNKVLALASVFEDKKALAVIKRLP